MSPLSIPEYTSLHRDGSSWFMQSEAFDYFAAGDTIDACIDNFWAGLLATIHLQLDRYGEIRLTPRTPAYPW